MEKYDVEKEIGKGTYGKVYVVRTKKDRTKYVLKRISLQSLSPKEKNNAKQEAKLLQSLQHPNIVQYTDSFLDNKEQDLCIVMEYCEGGDLTSLLKRPQHRKYSEQQVMTWFVQALLALEFVHGRRVLHRDLKSQNIFISKDGFLKLGDFGIARVLDKSMDMAQTSIGTPLYMSPELCNNRPYGFKSDIWSLGCILYESANLKLPFTAHNLNSLFMRIVRGAFPPVDGKYSGSMAKVVKKMLSSSASSRPSALELLQNTYIKRHVKRVVKEKYSKYLSDKKGMTLNEQSNLKLQLQELKISLENETSPQQSDASDSSRNSSRPSSPSSKDKGKQRTRKSPPKRAPQQPQSARRQGPDRGPRRAMNELKYMEREKKRIKGTIEKLQRERESKEKMIRRPSRRRLSHPDRNSRKKDPEEIQKKLMKVEDELKEEIENSDRKFQKESRRNMNNNPKVTEEDNNTNDKNQNNSKPKTKPKVYRSSRGNQELFAPSSDPSKQKKDEEKPSQVPANPPAPREISAKERVLLEKEQKRKEQDERVRAQLQAAAKEYHRERLAAKFKKYELYHNKPPKVTDKKQEKEDKTPDSENEELLEEYQHKLAEKDEEIKKMQNYMQSFDAAKDGKLPEVIENGMEYDSEDEADEDEDEEDSEDTDETEEKSSNDTEDDDIQVDRFGVGRLAERIEILKQRCERIFGPRLFKRLYQHWKANEYVSVAQAEPSARKIVGRDKAEYVGLIHELIFCENTLFS